MIPERTHTKSATPTDPEWNKTPLGETKIPAPIMTLYIYQNPFKL